MGCGTKVGATRTTSLVYAVDGQAGPDAAAPNISLRIGCAAARAGRGVVAQGSRQPRGWVARTAAREERASVHGKFLRLWSGLRTRSLLGTVGLPGPKRRPAVEPSVQVGRPTHNRGRASFSESSLSFLALPPWMAFMYSACPSTNSICSSRQQSASQYHENVGHRPQVGRHADDQPVAKRFEHPPQRVAVGRDVAMQDDFPRVVENADEHLLGMQVDATVELPPLLLERHHEPPELRDGRASRADSDQPQPQSLELATM